MFAGGPLLAKPPDEVVYQFHPDVILARGRLIENIDFRLHRIDSCKGDHLSQRETQSIGMGFLVALKMEERHGPLNRLLNGFLTKAQVGQAERKLF